MKRTAVALTALALVACPAAKPAECPPAKCGEKECAAFAKAAPSTPSAGGDALSAGEKKLLAPFLEEIRAGVKPWDDKSVGLCKGVGKECDEFLGTSAESLPEGEYMLRANLRVPRVGETGDWKVRLDIECELKRETKSGSSSSTRKSSKEYEVRYVGKNHGYRLSPLRKIKSPHPSGNETCTWKLTSLNPNGDSVIEGKWTIPKKEKE